MLRQRLRIVLPTLLAALAAGCDSPTLAPGSAVGTYALTSFNGDPIPRRMGGTETAAYYLLADTIRLAADGTGLERMTTRVDYNDPVVPDEEWVVATALMYEIKGDRLRVTYVCGPNALCGPGPHAIGRMEGGELVVTTVGGVFRFRRTS